MQPSQPVSITRTADLLNHRHFIHITLNVVGMVLPMLVGVAVVPGLLHRLGPDRFGALALAWALVGYFGFLDLGLGRALTQYLSAQSAAGMPASAQAAVARLARHWMWGLGAVWAVLLLALTPWIGTAIEMPTEVQAEAPLAWVMLAIAVPFLMWSTCCTGVLEARSRFVAINSVRVPAGIASFGVPWAIANYSLDLRAVMAGLLLVRIATALAFAWLASKEFSNPEHKPPPDGLKNLLRFGGWLTVTNLVGPMLSYFDRFAIAAVLSVSAVTYYTVPFDVLARLPAIPIAMMAVMLPLLSHAQGGGIVGAPAQAALVRSAYRLLVAVWLPGILCAALFGIWLLRWWVGPDMALQSYPVWRWIVVGVFINGFAHIPFTLHQSAGRTDLVAKIHLGELLPYALALWWGLVSWGITGAAVVWTLRIMIDTALLYGFAWAHFPQSRQALLHAGAWVAVGGLMLLAWACQSNATGHVAMAYLYNPSSPPMGWIAAWALLALLWSGYHLNSMYRQR